MLYYNQKEGEQTPNKESQRKEEIKMKRTLYKAYIIDADNLNRAYIYNTESPYSEASDRIYVRAFDLYDCKRIVDLRLETGMDIREV